MDEHQDTAAFDADETIVVEEVVVEEVVDTVVLTESGAVIDEVVVTEVIDASGNETVLVEETVLVLEDAPALELPVWEPTGDAEVDAALEQLRLLDDAELADHVEVFDSVHAALHRRLSDIAGS